MTMNPEYYMSRAIQLAKRGLFTTDPNPRVGCVLVREGNIVGEGWHQVAGQGHAEVNALNHAGQLAEGADCYVTLEPCSHFGRTPPCADALIKAGVKRVFIAVTDPNPQVSGSGVDRLRAAQIEVHTGVLTAQAETLNPGFLKRMRTGKPFVRSKIAMSLDGRTAMASGESQWITSPKARQDVQKMRARSSAIMTGLGTVLADDPSLTVRPEDADEGWYPPKLAVRQPRRIVVDSQMQIPADAKILQGANTWIATTSDKAAPLNAEKLMIDANNNGQVNLDKLMSMLAKQDINEIMVEAGAALNGALLKAQLIDELVIYMAPKIMGDQGRGLFHLPELNQMADNVILNITDIRAIGCDWRITAIPEYKEDS